MTDTIDTSRSTRTTATMRRIDEKRGAIRVEDVYDTDIDDLWAAVTQSERLAQWMVTLDGQPKLGDLVDATFTSSWAGPLRVDTCDAPNRLVVTMEPGTDDETVVEAVLTAEGDRTRLVVEERGLPVGVLPGHGAGWQAHLEDLAHHLAGKGSTWHPRWMELTPVYRSMDVADLVAEAS